MESYHHRPLWEPILQITEKKKNEKNCSNHHKNNSCLCILLREKFLKNFQTFFSWSCLGESFRTSPKTWGKFSPFRSVLGDLNTSKSGTWEANLVKIYQYMYIYIYTESIQNHSKSLRFQNSTPFSPTKDFRNGETFISETHTGSKTRQWGFVMTAAEWPSWLHLLR